MNEVGIEKSGYLDALSPGSISYCVFHLVGWFGLLVIIPLFVVPEFREMFEEFEIKLPVLSEFVIAWSSRVVRLWFVWVPIVLTISMGSGAILLLMRKSHIRTVFRSVNMGFMILVALFLALAIGLPWRMIINAQATFSFCVC